MDYLLDITRLDPLHYDLLFERFLNSSRVSMPDIDIDFCKEGRERVIQYTRDRYGSDCVTQIVTRDPGSRSVVRRRVLDIPRDVDQLAKKIPSGPGALSLKDALADADLQAFRDRWVGRPVPVLDAAGGLARHASTTPRASSSHPAPRRLRPAARNGDDITQFPAPRWRSWAC